MIEKLMKSYLDTSEAATYTGLSKSTLEKLRVRGDGPAYMKVGKRVLYAIDDLDGWMGARHRFRSTAEYAAQAAA